VLVAPTPIMAAAISFGIDPLSTDVVEILAFQILIPIPWAMDEA